MAYWLVKSEPSAYAWKQLVADGETAWTGVRSYAARNNLRDMKKGEEVFFYHSNEGLCIVGIAKVSKTAYPDPTTEEEAWVAVDLKPLRPLKTPVNLEQMKADKRLAALELLRIGRLSVSKVTEPQWQALLELGG